jgi:hypothetical protein
MLTRESERRRRCRSRNSRSAGRGFRRCRGVRDRLRTRQSIHADRKASSLHRASVVQALPEGDLDLVVRLALARKVILRAALVDDGVAGLAACDRSAVVGGVGGLCKHERSRGEESGEEDGGTHCGCEVAG